MSSNTDIDLSTYVALGDSITSGYADGALYHCAQKYSYANLLAKQFKFSGGGDFKQPMLDKKSEGISPAGNSRLVLKRHENKTYELAFASPYGDLEALNKNIFAFFGPFNNMGVPGAKVTTLLAPGLGDSSKGPGRFNPFFTRFAKNPSQSSIISDALDMKPTFFSLFIGNNDVMAYALSGATENSITPLEGRPGKGFTQSLEALLNALMQNGAKGAIANLPDILSLPFFTTVPYAMKNVLKVADPFTGNLKDLKDGDLVLFDILLDDEKKNYFEGTKPLPKKYVLYKNEVEMVKTAIESYNSVIKKIADEKFLAHVDVNTILKTAKIDRIFDVNDYTVNYRRKGLFSLDGIHTSPFGQALLANEFIRSINSTYGSDIPFVNSLKYPGINFP